MKYLVKPVHWGCTVLIFTPISVYANDKNIENLQTIVVQGSRDQSAYMMPTTDILNQKNTADIPLSITSISENILLDQHAKVLTDVVKNDASVGDGYAPIGYYANFMVRGFALDLASSYLINNHVVRGEQNIALENKSQVEILKGIAAIQNGMATPGGAINYVTKRPKNIRTISLDVDQYGDQTLSTDLGGFFGKNQQFGYRVNLAQQNIRPYVDYANGQRYFGSLALDWQINSQSKIEFNLERQQQKQRSVPGYQLLDGHVPQDVSWSRLLGYQSFSRPVKNNSLNADMNYQYMVNDHWKTKFSVSHSQAVIDDYSAFPYGCYASNCVYSGLGNTFDQSGNYDIYDFQSPDDTFKTQQYSAELNGQFNLGQTAHQLRIQASTLHKSRTRYEGINEAIGTGNIYQNTIDYVPSQVGLGTRYQAFKSKQHSLLLTDWVDLSQSWSVLLSGRWINIDEQAYQVNTLARDTDLTRFLPQAALIYRPTESTTIYTSYAKGLSDGGVAPWYTDNANVTLAPKHSTQYEVGIKQQWKTLLATLAIFDLKQDNQYSQITPAGRFVFAEEGKQHNQGVELSLSGAVTPRFDVLSTLTYTKARLEDIRTLRYAEHQIQNVPKLRFAATASYRLPIFDDKLRLLAGLQASSSKYADRIATAEVAGYTVFNIGAVYTSQLAGYDTTWRLNINNILNKKYWRDVGGFMGDDYMFLGNPRTAQLSMTVKF